MRISLIMNKPAREQIIMNKIKSELEKENPNCDVQIFSVEDAGYYRKLFKFKPNVMLTYPLTGLGLAQFYYLLKLFFKTKIILFRTEGAYNFDSTDWASKFWIECAVGYDKYSWKLIEKEIFWGSKLAHAIGGELLKQNKVKSPEDVLIHGNPRYENLVNGDPLPLQINSTTSQKLQSFAREKTVLVLTGFHMADYTINDYYKAGDLDVENNLENLLAFTKASQDLRTAYIDLSIKLSAEFPEMLFVVKKHPHESSELYLKAFEGHSNIVFISENIDSQVFVSRCGLLIHYGSTVLMESYISKVPSIYATLPDAEQYYTSLGWPSSIECYMKDVADHVKKYSQGDLVYVESDWAKRVLKEYFNITIGDKYRPSLQIAQELLRPARKISRLELLLDSYCLYNMFALGKRILKKVLAKIIPLKKHS